MFTAVNNVDFTEFVRYFSQFTTSTVDLFYIKREVLLDFKKHGRLQIASNISFADIPLVLEKENAFYKNSKESQSQESIFFSFSQTNNRFNFAYATTQDINRFTKKLHFCAIEYAPSQYQCYFHLTNPVNLHELTKIQRVLYKFYDANKNSSGIFHLKYIPGFYNTKYDDFVVRLAFQGSNSICVDEILDYYKRKLQKCYS